jgi:hypothetical protein
MARVNRREQFENEFRLRLADAGTLAVLLGDALPEGVQGKDVPTSTVFRLLHATESLYHSAVFVLSEPETSLGALALLRSLIETWVHLYFIADGDPRGAACRALRLERGWAEEMIGLAHAAKKSKLGDSVAQAEQRREDIQELWEHYGCTGKTRSYRDITTTIRAIEEGFPGLDWLYTAWKSASLMTHVGGWDWAITAQSDGNLGPAGPPPSHRASRLSHIEVVWANIGYASLYIVGVDQSTGAGFRFHEGCQRALDDPFLTGASAGDFD